MLWDRLKYEAGGLSSTRQLINQHTLDHLFTLVYVALDDHLKTSPQHPRFTFPALPDVTRYSRVTRNLLRVWAGLALCLANTVEDDTVYVVDSQPIPVSSARGSGTLEP